MVTDGKHKIIQQAFDTYRSSIAGTLKGQVDRLMDEKSFLAFCQSEELTGSGELNYQELLTSLDSYFKEKLWVLESAAWDMAKENVLSQLPLK